MGDRSRGFFHKFEVRRTDGRDAPGEKHDGCAYLVLDLDHDPHAVSAAREYARSAEGDGYELLARDIRALVAAPEETGERAERARDALECLRQAKVFLDAELDRDAGRCCARAASHLLGGRGSLLWQALRMQTWWPGERLRSAWFNLSGRWQILRGVEADVLYVGLRLRAEKPLTKSGQKWLDWPAKFKPVFGESWMVSGTFPEIDAKVRLGLALAGRKRAYRDILLTQSEVQPPEHQYRCPLKRHSVLFRLLLALAGPHSAAVTPVYVLEEEAPGA